MLVHRQYRDLWEQLPERVGEEAARQCYEHLALTPGQVARVNRTSVLRGKAGKPIAAGFSSTIHYEVSGAGRVDYQFNDSYLGRLNDRHAVVLVLRIDLGSH